MSDNNDKKLDNKNIKAKSKATNKIKIDKDPLFNIGDIVKHRIYPFLF